MPETTNTETDARGRGACPTCGTRYFFALRVSCPDCYTPSPFKREPVANAPRFVITDTRRFAPAHRGGGRLR